MLGCDVGNLDELDLIMLVVIIVLVVTGQGCILERAAFSYDNSRGSLSRIACTGEKMMADSSCDATATSAAWSIEMR